MVNFDREQIIKQELMTKQIKNRAVDPDSLNPDRVIFENILRGDGGNSDPDREPLFGGCQSRGRVLQQCQSYDLLLTYFRLQYW